MSVEQSLKRKARLTKAIRVLGLVHALAVGALIPVSWGLSGLYPGGFHQPPFGEVANAGFLERWLAPGLLLPGAGSEALLDLLRGDSPLADRTVATLAFCAPYGLAIASFVALLWVLNRHSDQISEGTVTQLARWAAVFAALSFFIYPIFTQDVWHSVAWGRMAAQGVNPYYTFFTRESLTGLPLNDYPVKMTYGPLWCLLSAAIAMVSSGNSFVEFLLHKLTLIALWLACLACVLAILRAKPPRTRALGVAIFAWAPMSAYLTIGECHNDIAMVALLMAWIALSRARHYASPIPLMVSGLVKYITLPLFVIELAIAMKAGKLRQWRYWLGLTGAGALGLGIVALIARDHQFLVPALRMIRWQPFNTPGAALVQIATVLDLPLTQRGAWWLVAIACAGLVASAAVRYLRASNESTEHALTLGLLVAILFTGTGHIWSWYLLWVLAPSAVGPHTRLAVVVLALSLVAPLFDVWWLVPRAGLVDSAPEFAFAGYFLALPLALVLSRLLPPHGSEAASQAS